MNYKKIALISIVILTLFGCKYNPFDAFTGSTLIWKSGANNYFNREKPTKLSYSGEILITGEVERDVVYNYQDLPWRSVVVKEIVGTDSSDFIGTYRYDGIALCDILSTLSVDKKSKEEFYPPVDLFVEIWDDNNQYVVFSWGELFYTNTPYNVILALNVTRVIPGKTGELWTLPKVNKIVSSNDFLSLRNLQNPTKIVIKSLTGDYNVNRDRVKEVSTKIELKLNNNILSEFNYPLDQFPIVDFTTNFYGQSMGNKGVKVFSGRPIEHLFTDLAEKELLSKGVVSIEGSDGYRAAFSISELINRVDHLTPLICESFNEEGRAGFSLFARADIFADRSVKSLNGIRVYIPNK